MSLRTVLLAVVIVASRFVALADTLPGERGAAGLWQALLDLRTTASALHLTAHPDDEDGPALTYLARGLGARTLLLTVNRGEGGADLIAPFTFDALGVLRSLEAVEASRHYGAEQLFTRLADYGYSKTLDEALRKWGEENILRDAVRVVRRERPDVIFSRFRGDPQESHATTYVVALMAREVFDAAADPGRFPEQIEEGLRPWQPKKLYIHNLRPDGGPQLPGVSTVIVPSGDYHPIRGRSYFQISRQGYYLHRTQGTFDRLAQSGSFDVHYELVRAELPGYEAGRKEETFFEGMDTSIGGMAAVAGANPPGWLTTGLGEISRAVEAAFGAFNPSRLDQTVEPLVAGLKATRALLARVKDSQLEDAASDQLGFLLGRKEKQFQKALARALALDFEASVEPDDPPTGPFAAFRSAYTFNHAIPGQSFGARLRLVNRSSVEVRLTAAKIHVPDGWSAREEAVELTTLGYNQALAARFRVQVADNAEPTRPYWHRDSIEEAVYQIRDPRYLTYPFPPPPAWGVLEVEVGGVSIRLKTPLRVSQSNAPYATLHPPLTVVPAIGVRFVGDHGVIPLGNDRYPVAVTAHSNVKGPAEGSVSLRLPAGWSSEPASIPFSFAKEDEEATFAFSVSVPAGLEEKAYPLTAVARYQGRDYSEGYQTITAPDLDRFNLYHPARHQVRGVAVEVAENLRIGYVMGSGDVIPQTLTQIGIRATMLGPADLGGADLDGFDAIVLGVRAYAVRPDVKTYNGRLLDYVRQGGVLIVQYQTPEFDNNYGPYPYSMGRRPEEVSEEDSPVKILAPQNPIFTTPNRITPADFDHWVEERGSKFLDSWDDRYTALVETQDHNQDPQRGGWVYARYGEGIYIYSAYAFYRQLPHGVPGAFRLYSNMLSLRKTLNEDK